MSDSSSFQSQDVPVGMAIDSVPRAFIVSPVYNAKPYIERHLESVVTQTGRYSDYIHVVVDDQSDDGTWEILSRIEKESNRQISIQNDIHGASALGSFMFGVEYLIDGFSPRQEDVFFWLDGDDWLCKEDAISRVMEYYVADSKLEMCYSDNYAWRGDGQISSGYSGPLPDRTMIRYAKVAFSHLRSFRTHMFKHCAKWRLINPETGAYWKFAGDSALFLPLLEVSLRTKYIKEPFVLYNIERNDNEWKKDWNEQQRCSKAIRSQVPNLNSRLDCWKEFSLPPTRRFKIDHGSCENKRKAKNDLKEIIQRARRGESKICDLYVGDSSFEELKSVVTTCSENSISAGLVLKEKFAHYLNLLPKLWEIGLKEIMFVIDYQNDELDRESNKKGQLLELMGECSRVHFKFRVDISVNHQNIWNLPELVSMICDSSPHILTLSNGSGSKIENLIEHGKSLSNAIDVAVSKNVLVNVRNVPMCVLKGYEKHIVNPFQAPFDICEYDNSVLPKTEKRYQIFAQDLAMEYDTFVDACSNCRLARGVCSGVPKALVEEFKRRRFSVYSSASVSNHLHFRQKADPAQLYDYVGFNYGWNYKDMQ